MTQINDENTYPRRYKYPNRSGSWDLLVPGINQYRTVSAWYLVLQGKKVPSVSCSTWQDIDPSVVFRDEQHLIEAGYQLVGSGP